MLQITRMLETPNVRFSGLLKRFPGFGAAIWEKRLLESFSWDWGCYFAWKGGHAAAFAKGEGSGICCGSLDEKTLLPFFHINGLSIVTCPKKRPGGSNSEQWGMVMAHPGGKSVLLPPNGEITGCYHLLKECIPDFSVPLDRYYWEMSLRRRKGAGQVYRMEQAMAALSFTPFGALLSQVATSPAARRQGQCSRLLTQLCSGTPGPIYLFCLPELADFYKTLSFSTIGYWRNLLL
mgnify:CR=1 FL=1